MTVNCITPGLIETDMVATIPPFMVADILEKIPMHRMGQPDEIARRRSLPRPGRLELHHRADLGRQRRDRHVIGGPANRHIPARLARPHGLVAGVRRGSGDAALGLI